jgi:hypothetical protein
MPTWAKTSLKIIAALVLLLVLLVVGATVYITYRKDKFLKLVNTELNKSIDGTIIIGDMHPQFFKRFPNVSLGLDNVLLRDRRFALHHHTLLDAKSFDVSLNTVDLLKGTITINHIDISNAAVDLYTDSSGYSNIEMFKKASGKPNDKSAKSSSATQIDKFSLTNVGFKVDDQKAKKLFDFIVNDLHGNMEHPDSGWHAAIHLDVTARSMAFSTLLGSFIKNKPVEGDLVAGFNNKTGKINVVADALDIGEDPFWINAVFDTHQPGTTFLFAIACRHLLWKHASSLVAQNIAIKLDQFDIAKPIGVTAVISGKFSAGDPFLYVTVRVRNNAVSIPGSVLEDCSFDGVFTNNYVNGKNLSDENSVIRFTHLAANYNHIPLRIDTGSIINLINPIATGNFNTTFPVADLNGLLSGKIAKFGGGTAVMDLRYKADIVNYRINKPVVTGSIFLKNADINNLSGDMSLKHSSLSLNFVGNDLVLSNFRLQTGRSTVFIDGRVNNFLNFYYNAPEKILLTMHVRSPQMHLAEFIGFLSGGTNVRTPKNANSGNIINQLSNVLQKGNAQMYLEVDNLHYNKFLATDVHADLLTTRNGLRIQNVGMKNSGGTLRLNGDIQKAGGVNRLRLNTVVSHVNIHDFFYSFDNFGLKDFTYENLRGQLSAKTQITAAMDNKASLLSKSVNGNLDVSLRDGALLNFKPLLIVGKYAFPFRDLKNIRIPKLDAHFAIHGDQIEISPLQISSSILNLDVAGIYGLTNGTDITMDIPLRNPKGDSTISDKGQLLKKRYKGIVLHLRAKADETGKVKIGLNKNSKDNSK